jgi:hypothetical protein
MAAGVRIFEPAATGSRTGGANQIASMLERLVVPRFNHRHPGGNLSP